MSDMKMSDHFPEAFQVDGNPSFGVQNCVWTTFGEDEQSTADQDSAIEHAVLNHDRMVEEIAELKDKVDELRKDKFQLIDAAEYLHEKLIKEGKRYGASINRKMISKLLSKLNQEWIEE